VRIVAILGAALAALTLSLERASGAEAAAGKDGGTFRVGIVPELFDSIDAAISGTPATIPIIRATCASLMSLPDKPFPAGLRIVPELAEDNPKITDAGKTYTFTIRKGVRFSTGTLVTARDVAHTIDRVLSPVMNSYTAALFQDVVGARAVLAGKTPTASGVTSRGSSLTIKLTKPLGDFTARLAVGLCVVPRTLAPDAEGAKPPIPTAAPYFVADYAPGRQVVLERNRFYRGTRPHRVDRVEVDLTGDGASILDRVDRGELDYGWLPTAEYAARTAEFRGRYGLNKSRFFAVPAGNLRFFALNTSRPLFRNNVRLRQAVNFAVDRRALLRERGPLAGFPTDQYLPPVMPGFRDERIYPLEKPDLPKARALARKNLRGGKAVLYTVANPLGLAQAQIVRSNLKKIGLAVEIKQFPGNLIFDKIATRGEPFDISWNGWLADVPDPSVLNALFDGRSIGAANGANNSFFNSPRYNRLLGRASQLTGADRYREYGRLDVDLARNAAPAIAYAYDNALTLVSARTGCAVVNPYLDLAAVCLK
jgi:peptide/nickel transport system substrate-binding protein